MDHRESGLSIGPYDVIDTLGRGGMGVVYRAVHRADGTHAALKTVQAPGEGQLASLRREIRALARIRHPGVVRILGEGMHRGLPWYAMELLRGETMRRFVARHCRGVARDAESGRRQTERIDGEAEAAATSPTPTLGLGDAIAPPVPAAHAEAGGGALLEVLPVVIDLCDTLAYLHGEGIVHRDLKPDNVLVDEAGRAVVVDFGLVRNVGGPAGRESLDVDDDVAGTVSYMAPEQVRGGVVDARADLYALGCMLFEVLVGRPPFVGGRAVEILQMHLDTPPAPPSSLVAGVAPDLDDLVLRLLQKQPGRRLGHAADVRQRLARVVPAPPRREGAPEPRAYLYRPGFAGRAEALRALAARVGEAQGGRGGIVLVGGEAGVGKTRLTMELAADQRGPRLAVVTAECAPVSTRAGEGSGVAPLSLFAPILLALADRSRERGGAEVGALLADHGALLAMYQPALAELAPPRAAAEALTESEAVARLEDAVSRALATLSREVPLLVVLDDLQWADRLSRAVLERLAAAGRLASLQALLLATYRSHDDVAWIESLALHPGVRRLVLGRLSPPDVAAMVEDMLSVSPPPEDLTRFLDASAEGNPFFVAETLRAAVAEGVLARDERGAWRLSSWKAVEKLTEGASLSLTPQLRDLMARRLDALPPPVLAVAEVASVLGREIDEGLLAAVAAAGDEEVSDALALLLARQVVEEPAPGQLRFVHDRLRQVAYDRIPPDRGRELHGAAAQLLTSREGTLDPVGLARLGFHWERAGNAARARQCYRDAAHRMAERHAHHEGARLLKAYLALVDAPTTDSIKERLDLGDWLVMVLGRTAAAEEELRRAGDEARQLGDQELVDRAELGLASTYRVLGRLDEATALFEGLLSRARASGNGPREAMVLAHLGVIHHQHARHDEARSAYLGSIETGRRVGQVRTVAIALTNLGNLDREQGDHVAALASYDEVLRMSAAPGLARELASALINMAELHLEAGRLDEALRHAARASEAYRESGNRRAEAYILSVRQGVLATRRRVDECLALGEEVLQRARLLGDRHLVASGTRQVAFARLLAGSVDAAREGMKEALAIHRELGDRRNEGADLRGLAEVELAAGHHDEARACGAAALGLLDATGQRLEAAMTRCLLARLAAARGEDPGPLLAPARRLARDLGATPESDLVRALHAVQAGEGGR